VKDLRTARDQLNQTPSNSSRPSGSMPPWQRGAATPGEPELTIEPDVAGQRADKPPDDGAGTAQVAQAAHSAGQTPTDAPGVPAAPPRAKSKVPGRPGRRVGDPGHGREQKLAPSRTQEHRPACCAACLLPLPGDDPAQAWSGWDTLELVALDESGHTAPSVLGARIEVTRHLLMQQRCACGHTTQAQAVRAAQDPLWPGVDISQQRLLGPRLAATLVYLCLRMRLPRRKVSELMLELFGLQLSPALIDQTVHQAARSVAPLEEQLAQQLQQAVLVFADETSWAESGQALWLWVLCCCHTVLYVIGARTKEMFDNTLSTTFAGTLMSDGYGAYRCRPLRLRCWAHLHRKLRGLAESTDRHGAQAGAAMLQVFDSLMAAIFEARARLAQAPPAGSCAAMPGATHAELVERLHQLCLEHRDASHKALRDVAREFLNDWDVIVRPLADPRLPLTNNVAERQLRHYVIARRVSYGTRNEVGSHSVALLASVIDTCRLRRTSVTNVLARAIHAARMGLPVPALPPIPVDLLCPELSLAGL
jgi:transposase